MNTTTPLLVGDLHGNVRRALEIIDRAVALGRDRVVQLGDFGWLPNLAIASGALDDIDHAALEAGVCWYFIGGTHDDWDELEAITDCGDRDDDGFVIAGDAVRYIPRPHRWEWDGVRYGALGGANSVQPRRRAHVNWWPQEQPTAGDAATLIAGGELDVLLCHDAPWSTDLSALCDDRDDTWGAGPTRTLIDQVIEHCSPQLFVHGRWHQRHRSVLPGGCIVEGLGDDTSALGEHCQTIDTDSWALDGTCGISCPTRTQQWWPLLEDLAHSCEV